MKFIPFIKLVGARGRRPPWSPPWVPVTLGHCEVLYVLFFLIFYSLFGPCPARPFIFPYLLLFIWPLPFPHGPALQDRRTDGPCPAPCPALPCLTARFSESDCPGQIRFSESDRPGPFRWSIKTRNCRVGRTHARTDRHTIVIIYKIAWSFKLII